MGGGGGGGGADKRSRWKNCWMRVWYMKSCFVVVTVWRNTYVGIGLLWIWWSFEDGVTNDGTLFKTLEAFRGVFFSTNVELKTKGAGEGKMMDSKTSLPSILTLSIFGCFCDLF